ncbi:MAG: hypothetical protein JJ897_11505 [Marinibacterium sp.]|nr:hypothetical protein [Marinibacterium sp.]
MHPRRFVEEVRNDWRVDPDMLHFDELLDIVVVYRSSMKAIHGALDI